jgi:LAO/AO transport system kinase
MTLFNLKKVLQGDKSILARLISQIENRSTGSIKLLSALYPYLGKAHRIGITGPPGVGKSTLVNELVRIIRERNKTVGIIAVDPTSIFTGGAILGDRIRMSACSSGSASGGQKIGGDEGVFIRSMATRGCIGGIARATSEVADILDASGKSYLVIETVGVGQSEVEVFKNVDTTILVLSPESGDAVQAMKAGIMEIADIIIVNKSDRPGADAIIDSIRNTLEISMPGRRPALFKTEALNARGITEVVNYIEKTWDELKSSGALLKKRRAVLRERLKALALARLEERIWNNKKMDGIINKSVDAVLAGKDTPYRVVEKIIRTVVGGERKPKTVNR